jgi:hypothetical protein
MFRGNYKKTNIDGTPVGYIYGDVVLYEGKLYKAIFSTYESPFQNSETWEYIGNGSLFSSQTPPINPAVGQQWEKNGIVYTYYYDGNNYSWVQF